MSTLQRQEAPDENTDPPVQRTAFLGRLRLVISKPDTQESSAVDNTDLFDTEQHIAEEDIPLPVVPQPQITPENILSPAERNLQLRRRRILSLNDRAHTNRMITGSSAMVFFFDVAVMLKTPNIVDTKSTIVSLGEAALLGLSGLTGYVGWDKGKGLRQQALQEHMALIAQEQVYALPAEGSDNPFI